LDFGRSIPKPRKQRPEIFEHSIAHGGSSRAQNANHDKKHGQREDDEKVDIASSTRDGNFDLGVCGPPKDTNCYKTEKHTDQELIGIRQ
jgi:hypothetical protein